MGSGRRDYERINVETELDHLLSLRFGESSPSGIAGLSNFELSGEEEHRRALMTDDKNDYQKHWLKTKRGAKSILDKRRGIALEFGC